MEAGEALSWYAWLLEEEVSSAAGGGDGETAGDGGRPGNEEDGDRDRDCDRDRDRDGDKEKMDETGELDVGEGGAEIRSSQPARIGTMRGGGRLNCHILMRSSGGNLEK